MFIVHEYTSGNMLMIIYPQPSQHVSIVGMMLNTANIYHLPMKTCKASWLRNVANPQETSLQLGPWAPVASPISKISHVEHHFSDMPIH